MNPVPAYVIAAMESAARQGSVSKRLAAESDASLAVEAAEIERLLNGDGDGDREGPS